MNTQAEADELHGRLADILDVRRVRDWARNPRETGYRALHLHIREQGRMIEVQLRTFGQDAWANVVEEEGRVVLVGSPSLETLRTTHSSYFGASDSVRALLDAARR